MIPLSFLPLREAARRSGVSLPTLRRRIRSGQVQAVLRRGPFGDQWEIPEAELAHVRTARPLDQAPSPTDQALSMEPDPGGSARPEEGLVPDRQAAAYWRGRWEELREVLDRLERRPASAPASSEAEGEAENLREALRQRTHELAHARNLLDSLRREKARLEGEVQALRERLRAGEPTLAETPAVPGTPRISRFGR